MASVRDSVEKAVVSMLSEQNLPIQFTTPEGESVMGWVRPPST